MSTEDFATQSRPTVVIFREYSEISLITDIITWVPAGSTRVFIKTRRASTIIVYQIIKIRYQNTKNKYIFAFIRGKANLFLGFSDFSDFNFDISRGKLKKSPAAGYFIYVIMHLSMLLCTFWRSIWLQSFLPVVWQRGPGHDDPTTNEISYYIPKVHFLRFIKG